MPCRAVPCRASVHPCKAAVAMLLMRGEGETTDGSIPAFTSGGMETRRWRGSPEVERDEMRRGWEWAGRRNKMN